MEDTEVKHPRPQIIEQVLNTILDNHDQILECINIILCSDNYLLEVNREYLDHDYYTDIITFPINNNPLSADLFISVDRVKDNANVNSTSFDNELSRVIFHGVLHLMGYGDKTEEKAQEMRKQEDYYLGLLQKL